MARDLHLGRLFLYNYLAILSSATKLLNPATLSSRLSKQPAVALGGASPGSAEIFVKKGVAIGEKIVYKKKC